MIGKKMAEALNAQMNAEFYNSRLYLSMATYFHSINMDGAMKWMEAQAREETDHAMKLYEHLKERNARLLLSAIDAPPTEWDSPLAAFEAAYGHECGVAGRFDELMALATQEKDDAAIVMVQWFVDEQVEEMASTDAVVQKLKMAQDAPGDLPMVDRLLGERE